MIYVRWRMLNWLKNVNGDFFRTYEFRYEHIPDWSWRICFGFYNEETELYEVRVRSGLHMVDVGAIKDLWSPEEIEAALHDGQDVSYYFGEDDAYQRSIRSCKS